MRKLRNRQWLLKSRPEGQVATHNFGYHETEIDPHRIDDGNFLIENKAFLCAPTMRNWMDPPSKNLYPSIFLPFVFGSKDKSVSLCINSLIFVPFHIL